MEKLVIKLEKLQNLQILIEKTCFSAEFSEAKNLIFGENATKESKQKGLQMMLIWEARRGQETPLGVFCTITLLKPHMIELEGTIKDPEILSILYGSAMVKFVNFASSFTPYRGSLYKIAKILGIQSYIIDYRHLFSHGKQMPSLRVFQQCNKVLMDWIKGYYWEKEEQTMEDVPIATVRFGGMDFKLDKIFPFYDTLADLILKNFKNFDGLEQSNVDGKNRWPLVKEFMKEKKLTNFRQAIKYFSTQLAQIIESNSMQFNKERFFYNLVSKCDTFMSAHEYVAGADDDECAASDEEACIIPAKRQKVEERPSIVNVYQDLIWHIAKYDYLKSLLESLFRVLFNRGDTQARRQAARFWILTILKSFDYYTQYYKFTKTKIYDDKKVTEEVRNVYSYQLNADLKNVIIFVGTQILSREVRYTKEFLLNILENTADEEDYDITVSLLPFVNPPLTMKQLEDMKKLVSIKTNPINDGTASDKVYTVSDLLHGATTATTVPAGNEDLWKKCSSQINWSEYPLGFEFDLI